MRLAVLSGLVVAAHLTAARPLDLAAPQQHLQLDCPGYDVIYSEYIGPLVPYSTKFSITTARKYFEDWSHAVPGTLIESSKTSTVGATRKYSSLFGLDIQETLFSTKWDQKISSRHQRWNLTGSVLVYNAEYFGDGAQAGQLTIPQIASDLNIYINQTNKDTYVNYHINACASPEQRKNGKQLIDSMITQNLLYWGLRLQSVST